MSSHALFPFHELTCKSIHKICVYVTTLQTLTTCIYENCFLSKIVGLVKLKLSKLVSTTQVSSSYGNKVQYVRLMHVRVSTATTVEKRCNFVCFCVAFLWQRSKTLTTAWMGVMMLEHDLEYSRQVIVVTT